MQLKDKSSVKLYPATLDSRGDLGFLFFLSNCYRAEAFQDGKGRPSFIF